MGQALDDRSGQKDVDPKNGAAALIANTAAEVGKLSVNIAGVVGHTQEVQSALASQSEKLIVIGQATGDITEANRKIAAMAHQTRQTADDAHENTDRSSALVSQAIAEVGALITAVGASGLELQGLEQAMGKVAKVSTEIRNVARQTNMLALNATIEAARAGEHGRGFAVVASEVKNLARQTAEATTRIDETLSNLTEQVRKLSAGMLVNAERAEKVKDRAATIAEAVGSVGQAVTNVCDHAAAIDQATGSIAQRCDSFRSSVDVLKTEASRSVVALKNIGDDVARTLDGAEAIMMMAAKSGYPTEDTPFVEKAIELAGEIEARFKEALHTRTLSINDLFDKSLEPIQGTNPQQYMTRYIPFLDREIVPIIDRALTLSPRVVFCAPMDHNKLVSCHNPDFRHPPSADPVWNAAHCRNRRVYTDKTALAALANQENFLLQTYRRDMGGGVFVLMKDASAPIRVEGQIWGGLRLCYKA